MKRKKLEQHASMFKLAPGGEIADPGLNTQFLTEFATERLFRQFTRVHLTARQFPAFAQIPA